MKLSLKVIGIVGVALAVLVAVMFLVPTPPKAGVAMAQTQSAGWQVGQKRPSGLRIIPGGRNDASHVMDPNQFSAPNVKHAYWVATQIPATLNQLYCWCGCENRGMHRSNLACFEDLMGKDCDVCQGTAEIAYKMVRQGITDPAKIQAAVDQRWEPESAKRLEAKTS